MRFRTKQRPRGLLRPSDQKRLALMIGGFGLILLCFTIVRRPTFWNGLFPEEPQAAAASSPQQRELEIAASGISHDEFLTTPSSPADDSEDVVSVTTRRIPLAEAESEVSMTSNGLPLVPADLLKPIKDDVIGVHSTESEAYYASMKMAARMLEKNAGKAPRGAYALFIDSPAGARGKPWRMTGQLRRLSAVKGGRNTMGVARFYDAWITTPDSGNGLVHVVAMNTNDDLMKRLKLYAKDGTVEFMGPDAPQVKFTGYFFKIEAYGSHQESGVSRAPLFVAGTVHEVRPVVAFSRAQQLTPYMGWLAFFVVAGVLMMVWSFTMSDAAHSQTRTHQLTKLPAHASFEDITSTTVMETLSNLESVGETGTPRSIY